MELTEDLIEHIEDLEGKKLTAYRDVNGVLTIGYGHTNAAGSFKFKKGDTITEEQALEILQEDLNEAESFVEQMLKNRNLNVTNQQKKDYMALVYFNRPWALRDTMEVIAGNNFDAIRPSQLEVYQENRTEEVPEWFQERINKEIADTIVKNTEYTYEPSGVSNLRREQAKYKARIKLKNFMGVNSE